MSQSSVEVLGIRHHGPGSARSVADALAELAPDLVVVEGAPELDALLPLAGHPDLVPPVAGLVYAVDAPRRAAFYPLAAFSPEWVAVRWALARGVAVRFADLPAVHSLAERPEEPEPGEPDGHVGPDGPAAGVPAHPPDAIGTLARAAGYDDPERWWEDAVEHRSTSSLERFAMVREAMAEVRAGDGFGDRDVENQRREAAMRRVLRAALKDGHERVAVVCGAYHAPVLHPDAFPPATHDHRLLTRLPRTKVAVTWAPWTADRLAVASGYGAGVTSPGWYQHLFLTWAEQDQRPEDPRDLVVSGWLTRVARALRDEGLAAAPASVVEAARLADALAAVRGRPSVGLTELNDATQAVLCEGSEVPLRLVHQRLVVGEALGRVPDEAPMVPLARDLDRLQRSLRLRPSASESTVVLDLRKEPQRDRSVLLHRLRLLGVPWGTPADTGRTTGTFKEGWALAWRPEFAVALVEAGLHGTTVLGAATALVAEQARAADLAALGALVERCFVADLPDALDAVVGALAARTAQQHDVVALLEAIEPLARTRRYGDVREADTTLVAEVLDTVVVRASVDLRPGCASLDDDAAARMRAAVDAAHRGVSLVGAPPPVWREALLAVAADDVVHGLVSGRVNRILLDGGHLTTAEVARRLSRRLSVGTVPTAGAAWLDGFLEGDAVLLLHDAELLGIVDEWVATVDETTFEDLLPLLRRTFARFEPAERRRLGTRLTNLDAAVAVTAGTDELDWERAAPAVRRMAELLGLPGPPGLEAR